MVAMLGIILAIDSGGLNHRRQVVVATLVVEAAGPQVRQQLVASLSLMSRSTTIAHDAPNTNGHPNIGAELRGVKIERG